MTRYRLCLFLGLILFILPGMACSRTGDDTIDREQLVRRHLPRLHEADPLSPFTVGNGNFAFTADITGLQTYPDFYEKGIPLATQSNWGWDYAMIAMTAARAGEPELAIEALMMQAPKNRYLNNGHNYQDDRLPVYLPGNGGLLAAVAMMAAGWDGAPDIDAPGFPLNTPAPMH